MILLRNLGGRGRGGEYNTYNRSAAYVSLSLEQQSNNQILKINLKLQKMVLMPKMNLKYIFFTYSLCLEKKKHQLSPNRIV